MTDVSLTPAEILIGAQAGVMRQVENLKLNRSPAHGAGTTDDWQLHIEGALGEMALAKAMGVFWTGKGGFRDCDVGDVDVRTARKHTHRLILHNEDSDDRKFYLVTGGNGSYKVQGWISGARGKDPKYWSDPAGGRPAFFIPTSDLRPLSP